MLCFNLIAFVKSIFAPSPGVVVDPVLYTIDDDTGIDDYVEYDAPQSDGNLSIKC